MTEAQKETLRFYTTNDHLLINGLLWGADEKTINIFIQLINEDGRRVMAEAVEQGYDVRWNCSKEEGFRLFNVYQKRFPVIDNDDVKKCILERARDDISNMMAAMTPLATEMVLYRNVKTKFVENLEQGMNFYHLGFSSCSLSPHVAENATYGSSGCTLAEIVVPANTPAIRLDLMQDVQNEPDEVILAPMDFVVAKIDRENNIITSLLAMVRMDRKAAAMNFEKVEIGELLESVIKRLRPIADKRSITITMEKYRPVAADVDEMKLSLAFSNLIENAVKYNVDEGWVRVSLKSDAKYFYVSVEDGGLGIPEDQIDRIFERFYRGDKSHSTTIEGTGLGLAITRSAITLHRGVIKVQSKVDVGTTFMVRIPIEHRE